MAHCVAVTGCIGSGKSTVTKLLAELGAAVISADEIARLIVAPGEPALAEIAQHFGQEMILPSGELDRKRLGARIFANAADRRALEAITHPRIRERFRATLAAMRKAAPQQVVVYDVPLLFETGVPPEITATIVVTAAEEQCLERIRARDGATREEALQRLRSQLPLAEKVRRADFTIDNSSDIDRLREKVVQLYRTLAP